MSSGVTGTNWLDLSSASNLYNRMYVQGFVDISGGNLILRNNNLYMTGGDLSLNGRLFVSGDVSLNNRLFLYSDASFSSRLYVASDVSLNGSLFVAGDISVNGNVIFNNISSTVNSGANWLPQTTLPTTSTWTSITQVSTGQYMIASQNGGNVYLSSNYGAPNSWAPITSIPTTAAWSSTSMSSTAQYMMATTNGSGVYISPYYGASGSWVRITSTDLPTSGANYVNSSMSSNGQYMVVANNVVGGNVYISTAYGASGSWGAVNTISGLPSTSAWSGIAVSGTGQYMLAGQNPGSLYMSYTNGQAWMSLQNTGLPTNGTWISVSMSTTGQYMLAGNASSGSLYLSSTFGTTWLPITSVPTAVNWYEINVSSTGQYMLASNNSAGYVYYSSNYGVTWTTVTSLGTSNNWSSLSTSSTGLYLLAAVNGGAIYSATASNLTNISGTIGVNTSTQNYTLDVSGTMNAAQGIVTPLITGSGTGAFQPVFSPVLSTPTNGGWYYGLSMSSTGQYMLAGNYNSGFCYLSTNYGQTWNTITTTLPTNVLWMQTSVSSTGQYMLAVVSGGAVYLSSTYGSSWASITTVLPTNGKWTGSAMSSTGQYILASIGAFGGSSTGSVFWSTNYGSTWAQITSTLPTNGNWLAVAVSSTGQYMLAGNNGLNGVNSGYTMYLSTNYGSTWSSLSNGLPTTGNWFSSAISSTGQYMITCNSYIIGNAGIFISSDYGRSWAPAPVYVNTYWQNVCISATGQYMVAITFGVGVYYSTNYGATWNQILPNNSGNLTAVAISANGQYMLVGSQSGTVLLSSGITTNSIGINNPTPQYALDLTGSFNLNNAITSGTNYGAPLTWTTPTSLINPTSAYQTSVMSYTGQYIIVLMYQGGLWLSANYGATFYQPQSTTFTTAMNLQPTAMSYSGQYMLAGGNNSGYGMYLSTNYGNTWTQIPNASLPTSYGWRSAAISSTGQYMFVTTSGNGNAFISNNYGVNWTSISASYLPTTYDYLSSAMSSTGQYIITSVWSVSTGVYMSTNYGSTFSIIPASTGLPTTINSLTISMSSTGQYMGVAGGSGTTYLSSNYGVTWNTVPQLSGGRQCISISSTGQYMVACTSSNVFYSNTYGATWTPIYITSNITNGRNSCISGNGQYMSIGTDGGNNPTFFISKAPNMVVGINNPNPTCELDVFGTVKNTNPYWVVISSLAYQNSAAAIYVAAGGKVPFNYIYQSNASAFFNTNAYTLTAPVSGRYFINFSVYIWNSTSPVNSPGVASRAFLYKNGSVYSCLTSEPYVNATINGAELMYLNAGDYIDVRMMTATYLYFSNIAGPATEHFYTLFRATLLG